MANVSDALRKLTSGQALTDEERKLLGMSPAAKPTPASPASFRKADEALGINAAGTPFGQAGSSAEATRAALAKLTGGQALTTAESALLGMSPAPVVQSSTAADKSATDAAAKAAADKAAADKAAAEKLAADAKTQAERDAAAAALAAANAAAKAAQDAANAANANIANLIAQQKSEAAAAEKAAVARAALEKQQARENIITVMRARFKQYGLETLATKIEQLAIDGASEATITLQLQETPEYQMRFKANATRLKNNLQVLTPAEYLTTEDTYRQVLRSYGLKQFDTDEYVSQFLANDVSPTELTSRVQTAVQRVQNADPAVSKTLRDYYGIGQADLVAYVLDPVTQFEKVKRQVTAAEIGTAARIQGLETGVGVAEQLAAQGVTQAEAQKGYATIADILPTAEKLSSIYGTTLEGYGQSQAEQEVFNSLASAQRARQRLTAREVAQFSGAAGTSKASLTSQKSGQI